MRAAVRIALVLALAGCSRQAVRLPAAPAQPEARTYREIDGRALRAYVFEPGAGPRAGRDAVLLFHGGGWSAGDPEWTFDAARRFAGWGLVAIAVQYRLSEGTVTPIEALDDACAAFAWAREHATELGLSGRLAGYGVSAGGQLVAMTGTRGCGGVAGPDALLLWSPALDVTADGWFRRLLGGRGDAADYSPVAHVGASTPPTCIVHGALDTLTPLAGAERYCDRLTAAGLRCDLNVYPGVGHLLTRNLANQESDYDPDPEARAAGIERQRRFLLDLGWIR